ncbi:MAG: LCP family protein [Selenomonadaceae bacterium]|nr:LCP family protein [Selenomonadaceae bacterium]
MFSSYASIDRIAQPIAQTVADRPEPTSTLGSRTTIMLMGVDQRKDDVGRSDTLMVVSLDAKNDQVSLLSIPRDTRVKIKKHGFDKINAAYAYGGHKLTQSTVENFLGVNIDHYVIVDTSSFSKIIDAVGGVDIDVEKRMEYEDPWDDNGGLVIDLKPGMQHMDGATAITYVRYRDEEGDAGRVRRQQKFMRACADKLSSPSIVTKLPDVINEARRAVKTDLSVGEMISIAAVLKNADDVEGGLKTGIVPGRWLYIDGVSYLVPNIERLGEIVTDNLSFDNSKKIDEHFELLADEYVESVPYYVDHNIDEYDENVNEKKDRELIDYLNRRKFELVGSDV